MKNSYFFLPVLLGLSTSACSSPVTNCINDEQVLFSCTSGKKVISVCSAPKKSTDEYIEYRFFAPGKPKFSYRADKSTLRHSFHRAWVQGSSSSSTVLWFENDGYFYKVNEPVKGIPSLEVQKDKKEIGTTECKGNMKGDLTIPSAYIKERTSDEYFNLFD